jgi:uncharacterized protein YcaQ
MPTLSSRPVLSNASVRDALLSASGLSPAPADDHLPTPAARSGSHWVHEMLLRLGYVQVDPIVAVERAHHHILFTRNPRYRHEDLRRTLEQDRSAFESWTHSAAILPIESFPWWRHYFARAKTFEAHPGYRRYFAPVTAKLRARVLDAVRERGPLRPADIATKKVGWHDPYFAKPTLAKLTFEYLWRIGVLAVAARDGQEKVYDLIERIVPARFRRPAPTRAAYVDWVCERALERLVAATPIQLARFFDGIGVSEARAWCARRRGDGVREVDVEGAEGSRLGGYYALDSVLGRLGGIPEPPRRLRLLNPFDPVVHDRGTRRTEQLFGYDFRMEIWVPAAKRVYGYYVLPILEGRRFTGRVDVKFDRERGVLRAPRVWWERGVPATAARRKALRRELAALARFVGAKRAVGP